MEVIKFVNFKEKLQNNIGLVIVGKKDKIDKIIVAFICGGHVLIEDVPGLGKTKLSRALAASLNLDFKRIQFTPDLLPSDLTGIYFYNQKSGEFEFRKGPLLSSFVLADEINRATPRTQSALLECMEEKQVTVEGNTVILNSPFFVIATQNPVDQFGTFPLPEAQMDRFFIRLSLGYPDFDEEEAMLNRFMTSDPLNDLEPIASKEEILFLQNQYCEVHVSNHIKSYILNIIKATRESSEIELGCSPRASLALMKASQAYAAISGREYVLPEDVKEMSPYVLSHRIIPKNKISNIGNSTEVCINNILNSVNAPLEEI